MGNKKETSLNWDDFIKLGNPENAPDFPIEEENADTSSKAKQMKLRIHLEKKGRGGKPTTIVKGWLGKPSGLSILGKELKVKCGVGGSVKNNEIIIQGNQRDNVMKLLKEKGYSQTKMAGG